MDHIIKLVKSLEDSQDQSQDLFESCKENLELNPESVVQNNPFLVVILDDFNVKSSNWCKNDITTTEGKTIENISSQFGLHQMINEPTHILESSSSCIDLIFTSQPNLITESGVHPSLHPNSHHQIIFAKSNLEIHYPPPYFRDVWHYQDANTDLIRRAIDMFDWDRAFVDTNVNEKAFILNKIILNILSNFIPHETLTVDDKGPLWFTKKLINLIQEKKNVYKSYRNSKNNNNIHYLRRLKVVQEDLHNAIEVSKQNYYSRITYKLTHIQKFVGYYQKGFSIIKGYPSFHLLSIKISM